MYIQPCIHIQGCIQKFRLGGAIPIEPPKNLSDHDLETILNIWNRKPRRIPIFKVHVRVVCPLSFHNKIVKKNMKLGS